MKRHTPAQKNKNSNSRLIEFLDQQLPHAERGVSIDRGGQDRIITNDEIDNYDDAYTSPDWQPPPLPPTVTINTNPTVQPPAGFKIKFSPYASDAARTQFNTDFYAIKTLLDADGIGNILNENIDFDYNLTYGAAGLYWFPPQNYIQISVNLGAYHNGSYQCVLIHELGHRFQFMCGNSVARGSNNGLNLNQVVDAMYYHAMNNDHSLFPTQYSTTDSLEFWAESFAYYYLGLLSGNSPLYSWVDACITEYKNGCRF